MASVARLYLTDGTTYVDLLGSRREPNASGISLADWQPAKAALKGDGVWQSSPLSDGRVIVAAQYDNVIETLILVAHFENEDTLIHACQDLDRLLLAARNYWIAPWATTPVYLVARSPEETNYRYATVMNYSLAGEGNPYAQPFYSAFMGVSQGELTLLLERGHWQSVVPGESDCVALQAGIDYQGRWAGRARSRYVGATFHDTTCTPSDPALGPFYLLQEDGVSKILLEDGSGALLLEGGRAVYDQADDCYVTNYHLDRALTHIFRYDSSTGMYSPNLIGAAPFELFPNPTDHNDSIVFGIRSSQMNAGPFHNLIFHISRPWTDLRSLSMNLDWEYFTGAGWVNLPVAEVYDATQGGPGDGSGAYYSFQEAGSVGIYWGTLLNWTPQLMNGVTAWWVKCKFFSLLAFTHADPPMQLYQDVYTCAWPCAELGYAHDNPEDAPPVGGDIPALIECEIHGQSDYQANDSRNTEQAFNRVMIGLRSLDRGTSFTPFLPWGSNDVYGVPYRYDLAIPYPSVGTSPGTVRAFADIPPCLIYAEMIPYGVVLNYTPTIAQPWTRLGYMAFDDESTPVYAGRYHAYVRHSPALDPAFGLFANIRLHVTLGAPDSPLGYYTKAVVLDYTLTSPWTSTNWFLADMGLLTLPPTGEGVVSGMGPMYISLECEVGGAQLLYFLDLILMPVDEWYGDFTESIDATSVASVAVDYLHALDVDSVSLPKRQVTSFVRGYPDEIARSFYPIVTSGPMIAQPNKAQRYWFLFQRCLNGMDLPRIAPTNITTSVKMHKVERYLSMRGAR